MTDYRSTTEKLEFSPRMEKVREKILERVRPYGAREGTVTCPVDVDDMGNPFRDEFVENPDKPYVINLANGIVRSWMETPVSPVRGSLSASTSAGDFRTLSPSQIFPRTLPMRSAPRLRSSMREWLR